VNCAWSGEDSTGLERIYAGCTDGTVYEIDAGTSLDGSELTSTLRLAFDTSKSPSVNKRYIKASLEVDKPSGQADDATTPSLYLSAEFSYASADQPSVDEQSFSISGTGGFFDECNWDEVFFDQAVFGRAEAYIDGVGVNISLAIRCTATYEQPHTIHGYELQYSIRGLRR
jgi:hypothetical protein